MRVLFDAYWWESGPISNRMVQVELINAWSRAFPQDQIGLVVPGRPRPLRALPPHAEVMFSRSSLLQAPMNGLLIPRIAKRWRADVSVVHNFSALRGCSATFIHDFMFMDHARWFTCIENAYFRLMVATSRRASLLLTSSQTEANRIFRTSGREATPIGLGLRSALVESEPTRPPAVATEEQAFVMAVGRLNARKNLAMAIEGYLASGIHVHTPLVVVGERSGRPEHLSRPALDAIEIGLVRLIGSVSDGELRWLYEHARAFLMLSLDEGFGLPLAEARHFGTPAVVSDLPVFHEVLGDYGTFVNPSDPTDIARGILSVRRGSSKVERHQWEDSVRIMRSEIAERLGS